MDSLDPIATAIFAGIVPAVCDAEAGEPRSQVSVVVEHVNRKLLQAPTDFITQEKCK